MESQRMGSSINNPQSLHGNQLSLVESLYKVLYNNVRGPSLEFNWIQCGTSIETRWIARFTSELKPKQDWDKRDEGSEANT